MLSDWQSSTRLSPAAFIGPAFRAGLRFVRLSNGEHVLFSAIKNKVFLYRHGLFGRTVTIGRVAPMLNLDPADVVRGILYVQCASVMSHERKSSRPPIPFCFSLNEIPYMWKAFSRARFRPVSLFFKDTNVGILYYLLRCIHMTLYIYDTVTKPYAYQRCPTDRTPAGRDGTKEKRDMEDVDKKSPLQGRITETVCMTFMVSYSSE